MRSVPFWFREECNSFRTLLTAKVLTSALLPSVTQSIASQHLALWAGGEKEGKKGWKDRKGLDTFSSINHSALCVCFYLAF